MNLTEQQIDQAFSDLKKTCGGVREDYFGLLYLENTFHIPPEDAHLQVAFGGNDYGLDGYHLDTESRNLYLFQFKWSTNANLFASSFERLIESGMVRIFGNSLQDAQQNQLLLQLRRDLFEKMDLVSRVLIHFVFKGDPVEAERSKLLERLREDLEGKKYLIDEYFGRPVDLAIEFRSTQTRKAGLVVHHKITHTYGRHVVVSCGDAKIWVIGKTVFNCLSPLPDWRCQGWVYQPNYDTKRNWPSLLKDCGI